MTRLAIIALLIAVPFAMARDTGTAPCVPLNELHMTHVVRVPTWPNYFAVRAEVKALNRKNKTVIEKVSFEQPKLKAKPKKVLKKKTRRGACGSKRQVWRTLKNGHRKYRCK